MKFVWVTSGTRNISKAWSTWKNFNRISRATIVTSGTRNISKAWSTSKKIQSHFSRQYRDQRDSQHFQSLVDFKKFSIAFLPPISWLAALATSPKLGRLQKILVAFLAPISWLAALATSPKLGRLEKKFNRISRANIVTSSTRNTSKAWSASKNFQSHFSRQYRE